MTKKRMLPLLSPIGDVTFKLLMGDEKRPQPMMELLSTVAPSLPLEGILELRFVDPHQRGDTPEDKLGINDIQLILSTREVVNVEVQLRVHYKLRERLLFYGARLVTGQLKAGEPYTKLARSICIVITDEVVFPADELYHHQFRLYDPDAGVEFTDKLEIHTLELPKLPSKPGKNDATLWAWMRFLAARNKEDMEMAAKTTPVLQEAFNRLVELSADDRTRMLAEAQEKQRRDQEAFIEGSRLEGLAEGEAKGHAKGLAEGEMRTRKELAHQLLRTTTLPRAEIAHLTKLSMDDIERLAGEETSHCE